MPNPKKYIIISHHIFLTKEQRYTLLNPLTPIVVTGITSAVPVVNGQWKTPAQEIFCEYNIVTSGKFEKDIITPNLTGYTIVLSPSVPDTLKDLKDGGTECLIFSHEAFNGEKLVVHIVQIEDMSILENSLVT